MINKINLTKSTLILIFTLFFQVSCSKSHEKYIGYWKLDSANNLVVMEITKDNNIYKLNENIIRENSKSHVLEESDDELAFSDEVTTIKLKLANDSTLLFYDDKYIKISQAEVDKIKADIKQKADNWDACRGLKNKYYDEIKDYRNMYNPDYPTI